MKKFLLPLLAACALTFSAAAQSAPFQPGNRPQPSPQEMAARQTQRLTHDLGLNRRQARRVEKIMAARAQDRQAIRSQAAVGAPRNQLHEQLQASRARYDGQLQQVLSPEQFDKYIAIQASRHQHGPGRPGNNYGPAQPRPLRG